MMVDKDYSLMCKFKSDEAAFDEKKLNFTTLKTIGNKCCNHNIKCECEKFWKTFSKISEEEMKLGSEMIEILTSDKS